MQICPIHSAELQLLLCQVAFVLSSLTHIELINREIYLEVYLEDLVLFWRVVTEWKIKKITLKVQHFYSLWITFFHFLLYLLVLYLRILLSNKIAQTVLKNTWQQNKQRKCWFLALPKNNKQCWHSGLLLTGFHR